MLCASLVESFRAQLAALGLELADLRIGGTQARPLVQVRIEWPPPHESRRVTGGDRAGAGPAGGTRGGAGGARGRPARVPGHHPGAEPAPALAPRPRAVAP